MTPATCPNGHLSTATDYCDTCGAPMGAAGAAGSGLTPSSPAAPSPDLGGGSSGPGAAAGAGTAAGGAPSSLTCPNCQTDNIPDALFCEACGYDFTTGAMPRAAPPSALDLGAPSPGGPAGPAAAGPGAPAGAGAPTGAGAPVGGGVQGPPAAPGTAPGEPAPVAPPVPLEWVVEVWVDPSWYDLQDSDEPCPSPGLPVVVPLTVRSVLVGRASRSRNIHPTVDCSPDIGVSRRHAQLTTDGTRWWIEDLQSSNGTYVGSDSGPPPTQPLPPGDRQELREGDRIYLGAWTRLVVRRATDEEKAGQV